MASTNIVASAVVYAGAKGDKGDTGDTGPAGANGADGQDGLSAYEVAVNEGFVGDETAWLASLVGPEGPQGPTGATGSTGPQGDTGATGATGPQGDPGADGADGLSAYEVALANDFVGTESEWLDSLVGPEGPEGIQGIQGIQGETGPPGTTTFAGLTDLPTDNAALAAALTSKQNVLTDYSEVPGLTDALATKATLTHSHAISDITGLSTTLDGKQSTLSDYSEVPGLSDALATKANASSLGAHTGDTTNPHGVTADQVGAYDTDEIDAAFDSVNTALAAKQNTLTGTGDVPGLDAALVSKQNSLGLGVPLQTLRTNAAGDALEWADPAGGGVAYGGSGGTQNAIQYPDASGNLVDSGWYTGNNHLRWNSAVSGYYINGDANRLTLNSPVYTNLNGGNTLMLSLWSSGAAIGGFEGAARKLHVRDGSGNPQQRWDYNSTNYAEKYVSATGICQETTTGHRWYFFRHAARQVQLILASTETLLNLLTDTGESAHIQHNSVNRIALNATGIGFLGKAPVGLQAHIADADGTTGGNQTAINAIITALENYGLLATS